MAKDKVKEQEEVRHFNTKPFPCGADRTKGSLVSGDMEQVTCEDCLVTK